MAKSLGVGSESLTERLKDIDWKRLDWDKILEACKGDNLLKPYGSSREDSPFVPDKFTVDMDEIKWGDSSAVLNTYGLGGCYAVMVYTSNKGENRQGIMMHYYPISTSDIGKNLEKVLAEHPGMKNADTKKAVIFYSDMESYNILAQNYLECLLKSRFGKGTEVEKVKYSTKQMFGVPNWGRLYFNVKRGEWHSWESGGKFE